MRIIYFLVLFILPNIAFAGIFSPEPTDKSVELLGLIFGSNIGAISLGGPPNPVLTHMFEAFNSVIVAIGTIIVSYIGIVSTINTAQEGKTMGKKWGSLWIPMRSVLGMALLVPTKGTGYSMIQISVMWIILQGVGAADHIWKVVLSDLGQGISATGAVSVESRALEEEAEKITNEVLKSAVCIISLHEMGKPKGALDSTPRQSKRIPKSDFAINFAHRATIFDVPKSDNLSASKIAFNANSAEYGGYTYFGIPNHEQFKDICGRYDITSYVERREWDDEFKNSINGQKMAEKARELYTQKKLALQQMFNDLLPLAHMIVSGQSSLGPKNEQGRLIPGEQPSPGGYKAKAIQTYVQNLSNQVKPTKHDTWINNAIDKGVKNGWISAGSFYFVLNRTKNSQLFENAIKKPSSYEIPACDIDACQHGFQAGRINKLRSYLAFPEEKDYIAKRLWDAKTYFDNDQIKFTKKLGIEKLDNEGAKELYKSLAELQSEVKSAIKSATKIDIDAKLPSAKLLNSLWKLQADATEELMDLMTDKSGDPLLGHAKFGALIMAASESTWITLLELSSNLVSAGSNYHWSSNIQEYLHMLFFGGTAAIGIISVIWIAGATLAIYVPLIPYMIFTVGAIGWFLLVVEAIVAAPILATAFILPGGEELGKIQQGLMLLLNILLRPALMLFGFIIASRVYRAVVALVNFGIADNFRTLDVASSMLGWIVVMVLYATFVVALANKCFALIYILSDKVLRWMGGAPEHTDASQEMHQAKGGMQKAGDSASKVASGYVKGRFGQEKERAQQQMQEYDKANGNAQKPGGAAADAVKGDKDNEEEN